MNHSTLINSTERIHEFARDGFCILNEFLPQPMVKALLAAVEALPIGDSSARVKRGVAFARRNLLEMPWMGDAVRSAPIREIINALAPGNIAVRAILFDKTGDANWTVPWHQDRSIAVQHRVSAADYGPWSVKAGVVHVQPPVEVLKRMLALRIHLDSCGLENGPLRVIPGTHHRILNAAEVESQIADCREYACAAATGGLLAMRPLLLHASSPARVCTHRRVIHIEFGPSELPGGVRWASC